MEITDVRNIPRGREASEGLRIDRFDDCFIVRDLKVIQGDSKFFVAMPSKKMKDGSFRDTVHPLNNATRQMIEESVLGAYELS